jgi:low affinity Fe/Cu permease
MSYRGSPFTRFAKWTSRATGHPTAFVIAVVIILVWALTGPIFGFSDTWQLVINTGTTIVTFLMVFLIQNTQNRDSEVVQLKLDELIRATNGAHNEFLDLEELTEEDLNRIKRLV